MTLSTLSRRCATSASLYSSGVFSVMTDKPRTSDDALRIARSLAIEQYARMESALCVMFAGLAGIPHDRAALIYYKIGHSATRNNMVGSLVEHVHGETFKVFWDTTPKARGVAPISGFWKFVGALDDQRNNIVHWHPSESVSVVLGSNETKRWEDFRPAFHHARLKGEKPIRTPELDDFTARAEYAEQMLIRFHLATVKPKNLGGELQTWLQIFQQPPAYPPPEDHPVIPLLPKR
ncbi:MAG: hypothetical protein ABIQ30_18100 [Devosia sp.]